MLPAAKLKLIVLGATLVIAVALVGTYTASPALHGPIDSIGNVFAPGEAYKSQRDAIDGALIGTSYSVMHVPQAGIAVIFSVSKSDAMKLSDATTPFATDGPFSIDPDSSSYQSDAGPVPELQDCYRIHVPKRSVAAVVAEMDMPSKDALGAMLRGLHRSTTGPDETSGAYAIYDNDHGLVKRLQAEAVIRGALQTRLDSTSGEKKVDLIVPVDQQRIMDVTWGKYQRPVIASGSDGSILPFVLAVLIVWFLLNRFTNFAIFAISRKAGMVIRGECDDVEPPTEAYKVLLWMSGISCVIIIPWAITAFLTSLDRHDQFTHIFLQPFIYPVDGSLMDVIIRGSVLLFCAAGCLLLWILYAEHRAGTRQVRATVQLFDRNDEIRSVIFNEPWRNAWTDELPARLTTGGTLVSWQSIRIAIETPPFNRPPMLFGIEATKSLGSEEE